MDINFNELIFCFEDSGRPRLQLEVHGARAGGAGGPAEARGGTQLHARPPLPRQAGMDTIHDSFEVGDLFEFATMPEYCFVAQG